LVVPGESESELVLLYHVEDSSALSELHAFLRKQLDAAQQAAAKRRAAAAAASAGPKVRAASPASIRLSV
jgi:hypothetical protein